MSDEEQPPEPAEEESTESAPPLDDHHEEAMKEMTLEERQEALKRSRWNVFLYLGLAALIFGFAGGLVAVISTSIGTSVKSSPSNGGPQTKPRSCS